MSSFDDCKKSQNYLDFDQAMQPVMRELSNGATPTPLNAERKEKLFELQGLGDYIAYNVQKNEQYRFELKVEAKWTGNLFIEAWSNRREVRPGWFLTLKTDALLYGFAEPDRIAYVMPWQKLKSFLWHPNYHVDSCRLVSQGKYEQQNDTWGWIVKIESLKEAGIVYKTLNW